MPRKRYTDAQIAMVVRELDNGSKAGEMARKLGVSEQTIYTWKKRFAGMGTTEIQRLRQLEEENSKLKKLVADLSLDKVMLTVLLTKKHQLPEIVIFIAIRENVPDWSCTFGRSLPE